MERRHFRVVLGLTVMSLVYDMAWFSLQDLKLENDQDGGQNDSLRRFALFISYISFFFRVSYSAFKSNFLDPFAARFVERLIRYGFQIKTWSSTRLLRRGQRQ